MPALQTCKFRRDIRIRVHITRVISTGHFIGGETHDRWRNLFRQAEVALCGKGSRFMILGGAGVLQHAVNDGRLTRSAPGMVDHG